MLEHAATVRFEHFNYNGDRERLEAMSRIAIERSHPHAAKHIARQLLTLAD